MDCSDLTHVRGQVFILTGDTTGLIIGFKYSCSPERVGSLYENGTADRFTGISATGGTISSTAIDVRGFARVRMEVITATASTAAFGIFSMLGYTPNTLFGPVAGSAAPGSMAAPAQATGNGGGGGDGGGCVAADTPIRGIVGYHPGRELRGSVWTLDQHTLEPGIYHVDSVEVVRNEGCELLFTDGRTLQCSINHRLRLVDGDWVEAASLNPGDRLVGVPEAVVTAPPRPIGEIDVVKVSVEGARTYLADGILSHNDKGGGGF